MLIASSALLWLCFCSSSSCGCNVRLCIWNVSIFFRYSCIAMNFHLKTSFDADTSLQCLQHCGWDETNSHGLPSPVEEREWHGHSLKRRAPQSLPWQAFISFLGTFLFWVHWGWSSFIMHRFTLGGYLLQKTKERMLLNISKRKNICKCKGISGWTGYVES